MPPFILPMIALGISIPVIAILSKTIRDITQMILDHQRQSVKREDKADLADMQRRMAEMEQRILTLQDLVIGGDYEVRRRLERAQTNEMSNLSGVKESTPHRTLASFDHD